jgi:hypothetical protein
MLLALQSGKKTPGGLPGVKLFAIEFKVWQPPQRGRLKRIGACLFYQ